MESKLEPDHMHEPLIAPIVRGYEDSYLKLSRNRCIFFTEDVSDTSAAELATMLLYYDHLDHSEPISLYLHSGGGAVSGLMNIYDIIQMIKAPVKTILLGKCYSAAAVILASGTKGERYALKSSKVMIHGVQFGFPLLGKDLVDSKNYIEFLGDINDLLLKILAKHTGQTLEKLKADCAREYWMTAQEAQAYGIIDHII